ncbi:MAG: hypothetical protein RL217_32 [Pseudomonadota bacterium]
MDIQELIENARRNETLLGRLQAFELKLLSCQNWAALLELLLDGLPAQFSLAAIGLRLVDASGEIKASILRSLDLDKGALLNQIEFHSRLSQAKPAAFSPPPPWQSGLLLPLIRNNDYLGELRLYADDSSRFTSGMATDFMQHLAAVIAACLVMVQQTEEQARLALTDPLTGAENRRGFERSYSRHWAQGLRQYHVFAMLMLDLDHFKQVNDVHGHATGDRALKMLCHTLKQLLRPTDHIGRLGGEEFALLLPGCEAEQLPQVVRRIQNAIRTMVVHNDQGQQVLMTASGSFISLTPRAHANVCLEQVLEHLDGFLYKAKAQGRDCFLSAS